MMADIAVRAIMEAAATGLETVEGITRAWSWPNDGAAAPGHAVMGYPTFQRGPGAFQRALEGATFPILVVAGVAKLEATLDTVEAIVARSGAVIAAVESALAGIVGFAEVTLDQVVRVRLGEVPYAAVRFDLRVVP